MNNPTSSELALRFDGFLHYWAKSRGLPRAAFNLADCLNALPLVQQGTIGPIQSLRPLLCRSQEDWQAFPQCFELYWQTPIAKMNFDPDDDDSNGPPGGTRGGGGLGSTSAQRPGASLEGDEPPSQTSASPSENLIYHDFRFLFESDAMHDIEQLVDQLAARFRLKPARRFLHSRQTGRIDLLGTLRGALATGGEMATIHTKKRQRKKPRLIVLVDVSQSMEVYSYLFFRLAKALSQRLQDIYCFAFDTRLVDLSPILSIHDSRRMRHALAQVSNIWHGGTRIAQSLQEFSQDYAQLIRQDSYVVILSDAHDSCSAVELERVLINLRQRCRHIHWLDPLAGRIDEKGAPEWHRDRLNKIKRLTHGYFPAHNIHALSNWVRRIAQ